MVDFVGVVLLADVVLELPGEHLAFDPAVVPVVDEQFERDLVDREPFRGSFVEELFLTDDLRGVIP